MDKCKILKNSIISDDPRLISQSLKSIKVDIESPNDKHHFNKILYNIVDEMVDLILPPYHGNYEFNMYIVRENSLGKFISTHLTSVFLMFLHHYTEREAVLLSLNDLIRFLDSMELKASGLQISNAEIQFSWDLLKRQGYSNSLIEKAALPILISPYSHSETSSLYSEFINAIIIFNIKEESLPIEVLLSKFANVYISKNNIDVSVDDEFTSLFESVFKKDKLIVEKADWNVIYSELFTLNILHNTPYKDMIKAPPQLMRNITKINNYFNNKSRVV